jgi:hypothetical protein
MAVDGGRQAPGRGKGRRFRQQDAGKFVQARHAAASQRQVDVQRGPGFAVARHRCAVVAAGHCPGNTVLSALVERGDIGAHVGSGHAVVELDLAVGQYHALEVERPVGWLCVLREGPVIGCAAGWRHATDNAPRIANGRSRAALARALSHGLALFQSNVAMAMQAMTGTITSSDSSASKSVQRGRKRWLS